MNEIKNYDRLARKQIIEYLIKDRKLPCEEKYYDTLVEAFSAGFLCCEGKKNHDITDKEYQFVKNLRKIPPDCADLVERIIIALTPSSNK